MNSRPPENCLLRFTTTKYAKITINFSKIMTDNAMK